MDDLATVKSVFGNKLKPSVGFYRAAQLLSAAHAPIEVWLSLLKPRDQKICHMAQTVQKYITQVTDPRQRAQVAQAAGCHAVAIQVDYMMLLDVIKSHHCPGLH